jgi:hypothetical protein
MVGVAGFEPATLCSQSRCATRLRYTPLVLVGVAGFEPATPSSRTRCATRLRYTPKKKTAPDFHPGPRLHFVDVEVRRYPSPSGHPRADAPTGLVGVLVFGVVGVKNIMLEILTAMLNGVNEKLTRKFQSATSGPSELSSSRTAPDWPWRRLPPVVLL